MQGSEFYEYFDHFPYLKPRFKGIFAINTLPKFLKFRHFCICNTDISSGSGQHWFCLLRNDYSVLECFDSLGISNEKKDILESRCKFRGIKEIHFNESQFQDNLSNSCGKFTVYYIIERMHNLDITFEEVLEHLFDPEDTKQNEEKVIAFTDEIIKN